MSTLSWLHLSDLHFKKAEQWNENIVLRALLEDVGDQIKKNDLRFDFIALTGDIAFQSRSEEYRLAQRFFDDLLKVAGLTRDRLILVPGNHDVDRGLISRGAQAIARSMDSRSALEEILSSDEDRQLIMRKFTQFDDFINGCTDGCFLFNDKLYSQVYRFQVADKAVAVLSLNSAWLCMGDEDRNQIALGERQVREALAAVDDADLRIALMHHPFDWLHDFDRNDCEPLLLRGCDFILHGHLHRTGIISLATPDETAMVIAAGAAYQTREYPNCYNFVQLDLETGQGEVHLRRYSDEGGGFWTQDVMTYRNVKKGRFHFKLPSMIEKPPDDGPDTGQTPSTIVSQPTPTAEDSALTADIQTYRKKIASLHESLPLAGYKTKARVPLLIEEIYVPLNAMLDLRPLGKACFADAKEAEERVCQMGRSQEISIPDAFAQSTERKRRGIVILGDPGAGKTTHLKRLLLWCLQDDPQAYGLPADILPVFLPLREFKAIDKGLDAFIQDQLDDPHLGLPPGFGKRLMDQGNLLLLFDGLDEVVDAEDRGLVSKWIAKALKSNPDCYFAVTCRFAGYTEETRLDERFLEMHLRPLTEKQAETFVRNWYRLVQKSIMTDNAQAELSAKKQADDLIERLRAPEFRARRVLELTRNPLLLTNICLVHLDRGGKLPHRRVRLYAECIDVLLELWRRSADVSTTIDAETGRRVLQPVAYWLHQQEGRTRALAEELAPVMEPAIQAVGWPHGSAADFLEAVRNQSGLLTGWDQALYGFMHLGFQEYLAAGEIRRRFVEDPQILTELAARFGDSWWQEVILLLLAMSDPCLFTPFMRAAVRQPGFVKHPELVELCLDDAAETSSLPLLELLQEDPDKHAGHWERQLAALKLVERLDSDALNGMLPQLSEHPYDKIRQWLGQRETRTAQDVVYASNGGYELVRIPGGEFLMGSPDSEEDRFDWEGPQHWVHVSDFYMGRYPVTNEEFGRFLAENTDAAEPEFWGDREYNQPRQPVVGVSWEDAQQYAHWAGLRLPSEAQWEYACRAGTETRFYSGDTEEDLGRVGWYDENSDNRLHPVGEKEPNAFGLYDMHGNVWEWVADVWHDDYEGAPNDGSAWIDEPRGAIRVIRGGSWGLFARFCRSASRLLYEPGDRNGNLGFRLVLLPGQQG